MKLSDIKVTLGESVDIADGYITIIKNFRNSHRDEIEKVIRFSKDAVKRALYLLLVSLVVVVQLLVLLAFFIKSQFDKKEEKLSIFQPYLNKVERVFNSFYEKTAKNHKIIQEKLHNLKGNIDFVDFLGLVRFKLNQLSSQKVLDTIDLEDEN